MGTEESNHRRQVQNPTQVRVGRSRVRSCTRCATRSPWAGWKAACTSRPWLTSWGTAPSASPAAFTATPPTLRRVALWTDGAARSGFRPLLLFPLERRSALSGSVIVGLGVGVRRRSPPARQVARGPAPGSRDCALDRLTGGEPHRHRMRWRCRLRPVDQRSAGPATHARPRYWSWVHPSGSVIRCATCCATNRIG
jgi:hypothetical protein